MPVESEQALIIGEIEDPVLVLTNPPGLRASMKSLTAVVDNGRLPDRILPSTNE
jgi:hypothetical protein